MRQQWFTHVRLLIAHPPRYSETSTAALTTPALDRRSLRWFGISACTATPEDLPPSLAQHGSCRRSSTSSSSLPFRTHVGAHNSVVGADQGFRAPSWHHWLGSLCGQAVVRRDADRVVDVVVRADLREGVVERGCGGVAGDARPHSPVAVGGDRLVPMCMSGSASVGIAACRMSSDGTHHSACSRPSSTRFVKPQPSEIKQADRAKHRAHHPRPSFRHPQAGTFNEGRVRASIGAPAPLRCGAGGIGAVTGQGRRTPLRLQETPTPRFVRWWPCPQRDSRSTSVVSSGEPSGLIIDVAGCPQGGQ